MFPVALNLSTVPVLLAGEGALLKKRYAQLEEAGAKHVTIIEGAVPSAEIVAQYPVIMVAGLSRTESEQVAALARKLGKLVNVEDVNDLCDFYFTANVRRGDLLVAVSTGGASPTLARRVRDKIAALFGAEWAGRVTDIAATRKQWKADGKSMQEVQALTDQYIAEKGWL